jgi:short subunit dehydrogenase-like uncharacterized protein
MTQANWMIYGANGYTGRRIAEEAVARGQRPILAGRNKEQLRELARQLDCPSRVFGLDDPRRAAAELSGVRAVLHCAGPFSATGAPMMDACLEAKTSYLDITGEIPVIEAAAARNDRAVRAGITLTPAVGFDAVPSDCLAVMLSERLPEATHLQLAFAAGGHIGPGTLRTIVERFAGGGRVRRDGRVVAVPNVWKSMTVPFRSGPRAAATIPWGDVATAWYSTRIPNIEVYTAMSVTEIASLQRLRWLFALLRVPGIRLPLGIVVRRSIARRARELPASERASLWGRASDAQSRSVAATLETVEAYRLTVLTALAAVEKVLGGGLSPGFFPPARVLGPQFILSVPGSELRWEK